MGIAATIKGIIRLARSGNRTEFRQALSWALFRRRESGRYQDWVRLYGSVSDIERSRIRQAVAEMDECPLISIIMPVYNVDERWLRQCIDSVVQQLYSNWELCLADDCSPSPHIKEILNEYAAIDGRIKVVFRTENGNISAASNSALELATGEFAVLLDHDDELSEDALFRVASEIVQFPETDMIYSDEDKIDERGRRSEPKFKPDFSRDLFYSVNLVTHLSVYRTEILRKIGGFRLGYEGSQDYDLALRVVETISEDRIRHIPHILYHWRAISGSVAMAGKEKPYAHERAREALRSHFERTGKQAEVFESVNDLHRVRYALPEMLPTVGLIMRTDGNSIPPDNVLKAFIGNTDYPNYEMIIISDSGPQYNVSNAKFVPRNNRSDAAKLNVGAAHTDAEIICFIDWRYMPLNTDWLRELVSFAYQPEIGAVGGKLLNRRDQVVDGGLIVGIGGTAGVAHKGFPRAAAGNMSRNVLVGNYSAVSAACMAIRRDAFEAAGGFDDENLPDHRFDVDLCLRLHKQGLRTVFTPHAELVLRNDVGSPANMSPASPVESKYFQEKWKCYIENDPLYNPNLSKNDGTFSVKL